MQAQSFIAFSWFLSVGLAFPLSAQWEINQSQEANRRGASVKSSIKQDSKPGPHSSELVFFIDGNKVWTGALISSETNLHSITSIKTQANNPMGRHRSQKMRFWNIRKGTGMRNSFIQISFSGSHDVACSLVVNPNHLFTTSQFRSPI